MFMLFVKDLNSEVDKSINKEAEIINILIIVYELTLCSNYTI